MAGTARVENEVLTIERISTVHFLNVEPTVLFIKEQNKLLQIVKVAIVSTSEVANVMMNIKIGDWEQSTTLGELGKGESNFKIYIPDLDKPTTAKFYIETGGKILDRFETKLQPQRHWEVFLVPITHHDLGYTEVIENIFYKYNGFYNDVLRFCEATENFPEESKYRYTAEQAWSLVHFIENQPEEVIKRLAKYIQEGRIETHAFFGNEITGLCGHEELIRLMYPSFRLKREYGLTVGVASITDVAGLSWGIPTVLAGAGVKYFYGGMPNYMDSVDNNIHQFWDEASVLRHGRQPEAFRWEGPNGESVLFYFGNTGAWNCYGCWLPKSYEAAVEELPGMLKTMEDNGSQFSVVRYGSWGCGDNRPPDIKTSQIAREWNKKWAYPKLIVATSSMFFKELEKQCQDVRVFRGELTHSDYVHGAMSTAKETSINRNAHDKILAAEKFAAIASTVSDYSYPAEEIRQAYNNMLLYDEHTWGMAHPYGAAEDWNWSDKNHYALKAAGLTESVLEKSLAKIAYSLRIDDEGPHLVVFNPLSFSRTDIVRVPCTELEMPVDIIDDETGQKIPCQIYEIKGPRSLVPYAGDRYSMGQFNPAELADLVFVAEDVPSLGYKTYRLVPGEQVVIPAGDETSKETILENDFFKVVVNSSTGAVESIYDKQLARQLVNPEAAYNLNQFVTRSTRTSEQRTIENVRICKGQSGPVFSSIVISGEGIGCPQITQEIMLFEKIKRIDFANRILKDNTPLREVYFAFPFQMNDPHFQYESSDAVVEPLVDQFPGSNTSYYTVQHWANVSDGKMGITLTSVDSHLLEFGGLWPCYVSPGAHLGVMPVDRGWMDNIPDKFTNGHIYAFVMDNNFCTNFSPAQQGDLLFRYSLTSHEGDWKSGRSRDFGWAATNPLIPVVVEGKIEGRLDRKTSFVQIDKPNVLILALKRAENNNDIILRLIETEGQKVDATVTLPYLSIKKTYLTNLVEENIKEVACSEHEITVAVKAFGITTIRLQIP